MKRTWKYLIIAAAILIASACSFTVQAQTPDPQTSTKLTKSDIGKKLTAKGVTETKHALYQYTPAKTEAYLIVTLNGAAESEELEPVIDMYRYNKATKQLVSDTQGELLDPVKEKKAYYYSGCFRELKKGVTYYLDVYADGALDPANVRFALYPKGKNYVFPTVFPGSAGRFGETADVVPHVYAAGKARGKTIRYEWFKKVGKEFIPVEFEEGGKQVWLTDLVFANPTEYKVKATCGKYSGTFTFAVTVDNPKPIKEKANISLQPRNLKLEAKKGQAVAVSWKNSKITGKTKSVWDKIRRTDIEYSTDRNFKKNVRRVAVLKNQTSATLKFLGKKTTWYVRIRYSNGVENVSKWTDKKKVTTAAK